MLSAHALGALDAAEEHELEVHLQSCAECRAELENWRDASASLAYTVPHVEPSATLRARILDSVRAEKRDAGGGTNALGGAAETSVPQSNVVAFKPPAPRIWDLAQRYGAIAAALLVALLLVALLVLWNKNRRLESELATRASRENELQAENQRLSGLNEGKEAEIARLSNRDKQLQDQIAQLSTRGDGSSKPTLTPTPAVRPPGPTEKVTPTPGNASAIAQLTGTNEAPQARGQLVYDRQSGRATLYAYDLAPAPSGKVYQLWFIAGGKPISGGVFITNAAGRVVVTRQMPVEARNASDFAITLEPQGGVSAPTGKKYLIGRAS